VLKLRRSSVVNHATHDRNIVASKQTRPETDETVKRNVMPMPTNSVGNGATSACLELESLAGKLSVTGSVSREEFDVDAVDRLRRVLVADAYDETLYLCCRGSEEHIALDAFDTSSWSSVAN
jgi:hypothetical protein